MSNSKGDIINLSNEITERVTQDNNILMKLSEECAVRAESDSETRIKLSEECAKRAEENSKLAIKLSESKVNEYKENSKLHLKILELERKMDKLSCNENVVAKQELNPVNTQNSEYVFDTDIPSDGVLDKIYIFRNKALNLENRTLKRKENT